MSRIEAIKSQIMKYFILDERGMEINYWEKGKIEEWKIKNKRKMKKGRKE